MALRSLSRALSVSVRTSRASKSWSFESASSFSRAQTRVVHHHHRPSWASASASSLLKSKRLDRQHVRSNFTSSAVDEYSDKILLNDLQFHAYHGVLPSEKELGQKFLVNVELTATSLRDASRTDDVSHTVDYAKAFRLIRTLVVSGPQRDLIETVGEDICEGLFREFRLVEKVKVRVEKPCVAIDGDVRSLGIELNRRRR